MTKNIASKVLLTIILYIVLLCQVNAQMPYVRLMATSENLDNNQINTTYQDSKGFVWFGTTAGVYRFDGTDFNLLDLPVEFEGKSNTAIFEDSENILWFGFENGKLLRYDGFEFHKIKQGGIQSSSSIRSIVEGPDKSIWIGTYGDGIFLLKDSLILHLDSKSGLSDNYIYCLLVDDSGNIWSGTDNGINICNFQNKTIDVELLSVNDGLPDFIVKTLLEDINGNIWIGMFDNGICRYNPSTKEFFKPFDNNSWNYGPVNDLLILQNNIWISTDGNGIVEYNIVDNSTIQFDYPDYLNLLRTNILMHDLEDNVWLISDNAIYLSLGKGFEYLTSAANRTFSNIHAIFVDKDNNLWFSNDGGLHKYNLNNPKQGNRINTYKLDIDTDLYKIMSLCSDPYGFIWAGTFGNGIYRIDPQSNRQIKISESDGLINNNVLSIKTTKNEIWFATLGGVSKCSFVPDLKYLGHIPTFENFGKDEGLINNYIYDLHIDPSNRVWLATDGTGVCYYEDGKFYNISEDSSFNQKVVYSVTVDPAGLVWMNVAREGLYKYDGNKIEKVITDDEHKNLSFSGIKGNKNNELIIVYDDGIDVLNTLSGDIIHFEQNAGLVNIDPDLNTITIDKNGNIWIGTAKGIFKYRSSRAKKTWTRPQPKITDVKVFLNKVDHLNTSEFTYQNNHLSINYSGLWYQYPQQVEYLIKLQGHDLDWIRTKNKSVIYSNLSPGKYSFQVKAGLYENYSNSKIASYEFEIRKPFWLTYWFWILVLLIGVLIIFYFIKSREKRIQKKQEILRERIKFQFENLKSQINPHFLFNSFSTLIALIDQDKDSAIEYVEELSILFRTVLEYKDQDVISLTEELTIIDNYIKILRKRYDTSLELHIKKIKDEDKIKIPPLTLQLLIENAIKHNVVSKNNPLKIQIYPDDKTNYLYAENNLQEKKEPVVSTGIGIRNIIERYKLLTDKKIEITKTENSFKVGIHFFYGLITDNKLPVDPKEINRIKKIEITKTENSFKVGIPFIF